MPSLYEFAGGEQGLHRLEQAFYDSVLADPVLRPLFGTGRPEHVDHLTAFTAESFGGPDRFSRELGFEHLIAVHRGLAITEPQRRRFVELYLAALDETGMPADPDFRQAVREHVEFGTKVALQNSNAATDDDLHPLREVPRWTWPGDDEPADDHAMLAVAVEEARAGLAEGGIPIGAALFGPGGELLGRGHNRRVQDGDPSAHGETAAFRAAGRQRTYRGTTMVTTLSPCWYCSGLIRQFGISRLVVGEATTFPGHHDWLATAGVTVTVLDDPDCITLMTDFIAARPDLWHEDIGED